MSDPLFLIEEQVIAIHAEQIRLFGGRPGIRDGNLLGSAVMHPQFVWFYTNPTPSLFELATEYAFSLGKNHPFIEGNKRAAIATAIAFLDVNGRYVEKDLTNEIEGLVKGEITKQQFSFALECACRKKDRKIIDLVYEVRRLLGYEEN